MADEVTDTGSTDAGAGAASTEPTTTTTEATPVVETTAPAESAANVVVRDAASYEEEIRKLRDGEAKYRTERNKYKEVFDNFEEDAQGEWLNLMQAVVDDPTNAYSTLTQIAEALKEQNGELFDDANRPLTMADINAMKEAEANERAVQAVFDQVKTLVDPVSGANLDPNSAKGVYALKLADLNGGDWAKVQEILESEKQAIIDSYVQGKYVDAKSTPKAPAASGGAPSTENTPGFGGDMKAAKEAALAYLNQKLPQ